MSALQDDLDALQVKHLGLRPTQEQVANYFNCCLNSACGAVEAHSRGGNRAVRASLELWRMLVDERCKLESAKPRGTA